MLSGVCSNQQYLHLCKVQICFNFHLSQRLPKHTMWLLPIQHSIGNKSLLKSVFTGSSSYHSSYTDQCFRLRRGILCGGQKVVAGIYISGIQLPVDYIRCLITAALIFGNFTNVFLRGKFGSIYNYLWNTKRILSA